MDKQNYSNYEVLSPSDPSLPKVSLKNDELRQVAGGKEQYYTRPQCPKCLSTNVSTENGYGCCDSCRCCWQLEYFHQSEMMGVFHQAVKDAADALSHQTP